VALDINNFNTSNNYGGAAILQFTGSGSKACAYTFGTVPNHVKTVIGVIKYSPVVTAKRRSAVLY
jgi:hypothetical protein